MRTSWRIEDGELHLTLFPETEGDKLALKYCDNFVGKAKAERDSYSYGGQQDIKYLKVMLEPKPEPPAEENASEKSIVDRTLERLS